MSQRYISIGAETSRRAETRTKGTKRRFRCLKRDTSTGIGLCYSNIARNLCIILLLVLTFGFIDRPQAAEKEVETTTHVRYSLPPEIWQKPFHFASESIPLERSDVRYRITNQLNFLLMDARSVLMEWLIQYDRRGWLMKDLLSKSGVPSEFVLFASVLPGMAKTNQKSSYSGVWFLDKPCDKQEGLEMEDDAWHDDRMDIQLATRCFAIRVKSLRSQIKGESWLLAAAAYISTLSTVRDAQLKWDATSFWDLPLPATSEQLITRWIAFSVINAHRQFYGLHVPKQPQLVFEQLMGIKLAHDLSIAQISQFLGVPAREVLAMNPKIKPANPIFVSKVGTRFVPHTINVPKGKGALLLEKLRRANYLIETQSSK